MTVFSVEIDTGDQATSDVVTSAIADSVHNRLLSLGEIHPGEIAARSPSQQRAWLRDLIRGEAPLLDKVALDSTVASLQARLSGMGPLEALLGDPSVSEVMVNGGGGVWVERNGRIEETDLVLDEPTVLHVIEKIVAPLGLHVDRASPMVDARLADGSRVNAIIRPLAIDGPCLTIRRFGARRIGLDEFGSPGLAALLQWAVRARMNIVVSGGAGSGKTTLLNALAAQIPDGERVVTIEDAAELRLPGRHVIRLEARPPNAEGAGEVRVRDLVRNSLRMRPDRIVVGEVRSGEALDMLQAMNTGHDGSLSTCHANSPADALRRIETLVLMGDVALPLDAVRQQVASALDIVVHVSRDSRGHRYISEVHEVQLTVGSMGVLTQGLVEGGRVVSLPSRLARSTTASNPDREWIDA